MHPLRCSGVDAWTMLEQAQASAASPIITMCKSFDDMLEGGIRTGHITEIYGPPSIGKSQLA
jgi:RecA/RadA recombinase